tara:strand:- start:3464 stop:3664 length:201 start_codon:yes stop_codon:yes gene_type:complete
MGMAWNLGSKLFIVLATFVVIRLFGAELAGMSSDEISVVLVLFLFFTAFAVSFGILLDRKRRVPVR